MRGRAHLRPPGVGGRLSAVGEEAGRARDSLGPPGPIRGSWSFQEAAEETRRGREWRALVTQELERQEGVCQRGSLGSPRPWGPDPGEPLLPE